MDGCGLNENAFTMYSSSTINGKLKLKLGEVRGSGWLLRAYQEYVNTLKHSIVFEADPFSSFPFCYNFRDYILHITFYYYDGKEPE